MDYYSHNGTRQKHDLWDDDVEVHQMGYLTEQLGARAVDAVNSYAKSGQPFLISLHFNAPHWPWEAPGDEAESKRVAGTSLRDFDGGTQKTYQRMIEAMDAQIGRVLEALDANGLTENTIVIFTSDNGGERFADTWPFTGKKTELLEGGLRIPMVIAWPARIPPGRTSDQVAISMDWLPTLLAAAGTAPDPAYPPDGMNLLPVLTGNAAAVDRKLFWRYKANWQRAARIGDYKFLKILDNTFLFNVVEDPLERGNLKERHKDVYDRIVAEWQAWNASMLPEVAESFTASLHRRSAGRSYRREENESGRGQPSEADRRRTTLIDDQLPSRMTRHESMSNVTAPIVRCVSSRNPAANSRNASTSSKLLTRPSETRIAPALLPPRC